VESEPVDPWVRVDELQAQLEVLESERAETLDIIRRFEELYRIHIAGRQARLEQLRADLATARNQRDLEAEQRAREAAEVAEELSPRERHRNLAKRIHPDRASSEDDRQAREELMKEINSAFDRDDMEELDFLEAKVDLHLRDSADPEDRDAAIGRVLVRLTSRVDRLADEVQTMRSSATWQLFLRTEDARHDGRDLLAEMAAGLDAEIASLEAELDHIRSEFGSESAAE
jgi:hypothetical protein